jgi:V/A-type H+-transporting ATPase subunit E
MTSIVGTGLEGYIKRNARERALNRLAEAEIEARQIAERAERRAAQIREQASALATELAEAARQRILAQASLDAQAVQVRGREAVLQSVWQLAREHLAEFAPQERMAAITALLQDAAEQLGGGDLILQVNARDAALLDDVAMEALRDSVEPLGVTSLALDEARPPIMGGVVVHRIDRTPGASRAARRLVDNSWDERLRLSYQALREEVYALLCQSADTADQGRGILP